MNASKALRHLQLVWLPTAFYATEGVSQLAGKPACNAHKDAVLASVVKKKLTAAVLANNLHHCLKT